MSIWTKQMRTSGGRVCMPDHRSVAPQCPKISKVCIHSWAGHCSSSRSCSHPPAAWLSRVQSVLPITVSTAPCWGKISLFSIRKKKNLCFRRHTGDHSTSGLMRFFSDLKVQVPQIQHRRRLRPGPHVPAPVGAWRARASTCLHSS